MTFHRATDPVVSTVDNWIHTRVLVLDASYEALTEIAAERAVVLVMGGTAEPVADREPHFPIRSRHLEIALPETIRLLRYVYLDHETRMHDDSRATLAGVLTISSDLQAVATMRRDNHRCGYCASWARTVDHIRPRSRGGPDTWIAACAPCNSIKADRTPEEAGMRLLWEPKAPDHMAERQQRIWKQLATT